jgi:hypothetical protein
VIEVQPGSEIPLVIIIIGLLVLAIIAVAALFIKKILKKKQLHKTRPKIADFPHQNLYFKPEINLIRRMVPVVQSQRVRTTADPAQREIDILNGRSDITQSLLALVEKYSLDTFTIATSDGLVFASSGGDDAQTNAATYSLNASRDPPSNSSIVIVPDLTHKGSTLIGIIRTQNPVSDEIVKKISKDTQTILNWWV